MPQAAWEALLRDAVQGLRPHYTPQSPPPMAPGHPPPGLGHPRPLPTLPLPHQEGEGQGQGEGKGQQPALRQEGTEGPQVEAGTHRDRAPEETQHGGRRPPKNQEGAGAGTEAQRKKAPRQTPRPTPRKGIPRRGDQRRATPTERRMTSGGAPPNTHRRGKHRTPDGSHKRTPTSHRKPHGGWRAHLHGENGPHPQRKPQGTPPRGAPPRPHRQAMTPAATRATSQAPEEDEGTATATRARDRDPQRTRDQGTGPQGGQTHGRLPDQPARAARPGPHSTDSARHPHLTAPPSHQPATLRPALRTTTQARLTSTDPPRHNARPRHTAPQRGARRGLWGEGEVDVGRRWRAWRRQGEREHWWPGLGVGVVYGRRGEGEVDMGRRWRSLSGPGERERRERGPGGLCWRLGEQERREWVVEARWWSGECGRRGRVCPAGGEREHRCLRDRASSLEAGQSGGFGGSSGASRGAAWYGGGGEVPRRPWIRHVGVWRRQRLVVWVE